MARQQTVLTVVGARPHFVKAATVSRALADAHVDECLVHTGQHYDWEMSQVFFDGLALPSPEVNLNIRSGKHGEQTGRMLEGLEKVMIERVPGIVMVYGDTNSTIAGALAAVKLHIPIAHVEAGLHSFNRRMPEEINRVVTDHVSNLLFAPTRVAAENLAAEGISNGVVRTGDVMYDLALQTAVQLEAKRDEILNRVGVEPGQYTFVTIHRAENTDDPQRWNAIVDGLKRIGGAGTPVIWPAHPRTNNKVAGLCSDTIKIIRPVPYLEAQTLIRFARVVITDSGGVQKEAAFRGTPCRTVRTETEWTELLDCGVNKLVDANPERMLADAAAASWPESGLPDSLYGDGHTSEVIATSIRAYLEES